MSIASEYWKNSLKDIEMAMKNVKVGNSRVIGYSAGKREIYLAEYGLKQNMGRRANYNSACGAGDPSFYAHKSGSIKPVVCFIGGIHGGEIEGVSGVLNLMHLLENGEDLRGNRWDSLKEKWKDTRILLIPCLNPDGRARVPFKCVSELGEKKAWYYKHGTWRDGSPCNWPECKSIHPILGEAGYLGGYFNDDGVNLMHDNFFLPMAPETKALLGLADSEAPDLTILLHTGTDCHGEICPEYYLPGYMQKNIQAFDRIVYEAFQKEGFRFGSGMRDIPSTDSISFPPPSFNLTAAIHHICGGMSITYESNVAMDEEGNVFYCGSILNSHMILFREAFSFLENCYDLERREMKK